MPVHDWKKVEAGIFHDFHHTWIAEIKRSLNRALQGTEYYALAEQITGDKGPDVLTLKSPLPESKPEKKNGRRRSAGTVLAESPPKMAFRITNTPSWYVAKKKAITVRHISDHEVVAVLEIVSPGNKGSERALSLFVATAQELLSACINVDIVDLFPPTVRDPEGIHPAIWGDDHSSEFHFNPAKPFTLASYIGGTVAQAYVQPVGLGGKLPSIPLFLTRDRYISVPLEATYQAAFADVPDFWREKLEQVDESPRIQTEAGAEKGRRTPVRANRSRSG